MASSRSDVASRDRAASCAARSSGDRRGESFTRSECGDTHHLYTSSDSKQSVTNRQREVAPSTWACWAGVLRCLRPEGHPSTASCSGRGGDSGRPCGWSGGCPGRPCGWSGGHPGNPCVTLPACPPTPLPCPLRPSVHAPANFRSWCRSRPSPSTSACRSVTSVDSCTSAAFRT